MENVRHALIGIVLFLLLVINTVLFAIPVIVVALLKLIPGKKWRQLMSSTLESVARAWMAINNVASKALLPLTIKISGDMRLDRHHSYLLLCNHQSWMDIVILQRFLLGRIPFMRFFMKSQLLYVPVIGLACWALDFPIMRRHSKAHLQKHPHKRIDDIMKTKKSCARLKGRKVTIVNFSEGTRFSEEKRLKQGSPYRYLLKPRAGGIATALFSLSGQLDYILDITIHYRCDRRRFWDFLSGRMREVSLHMELVPVTEELIGDYHGDEAFKQRFQSWLNDRWQQKEERLEQNHS
ncbi:MAG: acyltransferase [Francisellaceae bacterium]